jgi:hypothetical protein
MIHWRWYHCSECVSLWSVSWAFVCIGSLAIPIAFGMIGTGGYEAALIMIKLLLQRGATGIPVHQTLLTAARQDHRLEIVRLLVEYGADANYATGAPFAVALETANFKLLEILCAGCPPSRASLVSVLSIAIDPRYYNLQALELLSHSATCSAAAATLKVLSASGKLRCNPNMTEIVTCFMRHWLDVDIGDGVLLCLAIQEKNIILLRGILSANPTITSLKAAFQIVSSVQPRDSQLETMRLLLEQAKSVEIGQSRLLLQQTHLALAGDSKGLQLLLIHRAAVDLDDGPALQAAAAAGSLEVLNLLLLSRPAPSTIRTACLAAATSALIQDQKHHVLELLLAANGGLSADEMPKLLADSVAKLPEHTQLPQLLLARRAEVQTQTLKIVLEKSSHELFVTLATSIRSTNTIVCMFKYARKTIMLARRRYRIYQCLLGRGIPSDDVSKALFDSLKADNIGDLSLPKLLLEHGAVVGYKNGSAFSLALQANSLEAVKLLSQYLVDDITAGIMFDRVRKTASLDPHDRGEVYRCLLQWNIDKSSMYHALVDSLKSGHPDVSVVRLLLAKGADPNKNEARCFIIAATAESGIHVPSTQ